MGWGGVGGGSGSGEVARDPVEEGGLFRGGSVSISAMCSITAAKDTFVTVSPGPKNFKLQRVNEWCMLKRRRTLDKRQGCFVCSCAGQCFRTTYMEGTLLTTGWTVLPQKQPRYPMATTVVTWRRQDMPRETCNDTNCGCTSRATMQKEKNT